MEALDRQTGARIRVDMALMNGLYNLDAEGVCLVFDAIESAPIFEVNYIYFYYPQTGLQLNRFQKLFQVLASVTRLDSLILTFQARDNDGRGFGYAICELARVNRLSIHASWIIHEGLIVGLTSDRFDMAPIVQSIRAQQSLIDIDIQMNGLESYPMLLEALQHVPTLRHLSLKSGAGICTREVALALATFVQSDAPKLRHDIVFFDFSNLEALATFCEGVIGSRIRTVNILRGIVPFGDELAWALTHSPMRDICLSWLASFEFDLPATMAVLSAHLPQMAQLEKVLCGCNPADAPVGNFVDTALDVVRIIPTCANLVSLEVNMHSFTEEMDNALATCIRVNSSLQEISLTCVKRDPGTSTAPNAPNAMLKALAASYTLTYIHFQTYSDNGRIYLRDKPGDKNMGYTVLEGVKDDMACLYYHLRENPSLVR
ncbi:hypothetical protein MPSEU_000907100 [Mayamaea pseudoterrestris]|nr:hypothetical protein MPSEU_000907100 [Mayamaea pseudoterrestris]